MITFDDLVSTLISYGVEINNQFKIPDNIPFISNGNTIEYLDKNQKVQIIFCKVGFADRCIMATIGNIDNLKIPVKSFTMIDRINTKIIQETLTKYGVIEFR